MQKKVFQLLVENQAGVLSRISGLFSRRGYNIESITVGLINDNKHSRMTIMASGEDTVLEQIERQVAKLEDVRDIKILNPEVSVFRELMMVKVKVTASQRTDVAAVSDIFRANVVDISTDSITVELIGDQTKLKAFHDVLASYEILEVARTGIIGLGRGTDNLLSLPACCGATEID